MKIIDTDLLPLGFTCETVDGIIYRGTNESILAPNKEPA
jgi:hypothetical protein